MAAKKTQTRDDISLRKTNPNFERKQIQMPKKNPKNGVPAWVIITFIFALVFCLFSIYKVFIYGKGYNTSFDQYFNFFKTSQTTEPIAIEEVEEISAPLETLNTFAENAEQNSQNETAEQPQENHQNLPQTPEPPQNNETPALNAHPEATQGNENITKFYEALLNGKLEEMNAFVHAPLKNSQTWQNHWNKKNINIFRNNLDGELKIMDIFLIPGSVNETKKTKQYSYKLKYTIKPNHHFEEDWQITLLNTADKTLISEIMCTTKGCSRSPFFWPQNYNLK